MPSQPEINTQTEEEVQRCKHCTHMEGFHHQDQELDLDGRPLGAPYDSCFGCVQDDAGKAGWHAFEPVEAEDEGARRRAEAERFYRVSEWDRYWVLRNAHLISAFIAACEYEAVIHKEATATLNAELELARMESAGLAGTLFQVRDDFYRERIHAEAADGRTG